MTPVVFLPVGLRQVGMLKQDMADAGMVHSPGGPPWTLKWCLSSWGSSGGVDVRVHEAVGQISGHSHQSPKVSNKHAEGRCLARTATGCSFFPGSLQVIIYGLNKTGNGPQFVELAASTADH